MPSTTMPVSKSSVMQSAIRKWRDEMSRLMVENWKLKRQNINLAQKYDSLQVECDILREEIKELKLYRKRG